MAASLGNALGGLGGISKLIQGRGMEKRAEEAIKNFKWQELRNPFEDLSVSRLGADLRREENARNMASSIDALQSGGVRGVVGGIGKLNQQNNLLSKDIGAGLDEQRRDIDRSKAGYDTQIQSMIERRQANELAGYGQMMNVGMGMKYQGFTNLMNAGNAQEEYQMAKNNMGMYNSFFQQNPNPQSNINPFISGGGFGGYGISDRRLKKNIQLIGKSLKGLNIYLFEFINSKYGIGVFQGVMSDEIPQEAVVKLSNGYNAVNYNMIDVEFKRIK